MPILRPRDCTDLQPQQDVHLHANICDAWRQFLADTLILFQKDGIRREMISMPKVMVENGEGIIYADINWDRCPKRISMSIPDWSWYFKWEMQ